MKATTRENYRPSHSDLKTHKESLRPDPLQQVYFVDDNLYQNLLSLYSECLVVFAKIAGGYKTLNIGTLTEEILSKISKHDFAEIEKKVNDQIAENLKSFTNIVVLENLRKGTQEPFNWYKIHTDLDLFEIERIKRNHPGIELNTDGYSILDGVLSFTDEDRVRLKQKYATIYLDSDQKRQFKELSETTLENLQSIKGILLKNGIQSLFGDGSLFADNDSGVILNKMIMKFIK